MCVRDCVRACVPDSLGFCDSGLVYDEGVGSARQILSAVVKVWEGPGGASAASMIRVCCDEKKLSRDGVPMQ